MKKNYIIIILAFLTWFGNGCSPSKNTENQDVSSLRKASSEEIEKLIEQFIMAQEGSHISIPDGFYEINSQLILDNINDVTISGAGMDKTILSFKTLKVGAEGIKIVGDRILLRDFSVYDAPGDGIKSQNCDSIVFQRINATWTNGDKSKNGTYAIYPVQCSNVWVDECQASHSRDAGIYVGQSENIVVKNCTAFGNVAGIEIENSSNADVFHNKAYDNAAGILVFNLPGLEKSDGQKTRIFENEVIENNHKNFATPVGSGPNGNTVTLIPPGSGIILLAAKDIEVYNNKILKNKTVGIAIASYHITGFPIDTALTNKGWYPYSRNISIHDNTYEQPGLTSLPDMSRDLGKLISMKNAYGVMKNQDIVYDGIFDDAYGEDIKKNPMNICISEKNASELRFTLFELAEKTEDIKAFKGFELLPSCSPSSPLSFLHTP